jgi:peptidoglycan hydrolase-like protein with peptidoglycan-binding domain
MTKRNLLSIFGAALLASAAPVVSGAGRAVAAQTSSATSSTSTVAKKKKHTSSKYKKKSRVKAQAAPTPDRIKEIQTALQKDGSYDGEPTGKWDAATAEAMRKYQDKNGFTPTGKIDALSLNKLGLGSETAGKGAPVPSASATPSPAPSPSASSDSPADPPAKQ